MCPALVVQWHLQFGDVVLQEGVCYHCHVRPVPLPLAGLHKAAVATSQRPHGPQFRAIGFRLGVLNLDRLQMCGAAASLQAAFNASAATQTLRCQVWEPTDWRSMH
jgi:hypothetical protein